MDIKLETCNLGGKVKQLARLQLAQLTFSSRLTSITSERNKLGHVYGSRFVRWMAEAHGLEIQKAWSHRQELSLLS
jgi:hypothetical protein